jgi:hypothetical protein
MIHPLDRGVDMKKARHRCLAFRCSAVRSGLLAA